MSRSAMATRFAFGFTLFATPILAATIGFSSAAALPFGSTSGPALSFGAVSSEIVSLDGEALRELSDSDLFREGVRSTERPQLPALFFDELNRITDDRAAAALDSELLEMFQEGPMQRSGVEGLFWRIGSPIADH